MIGYRETYPTQAARQQFAPAFSGNLALRLFYGVPHDLASVGGYVEFRVIGMLAVLACGLGGVRRRPRPARRGGRRPLRALIWGRGRSGATAVVLAALLLECGALWLVTRRRCGRRRPCPAT